jgi:ADP-ribose pyrophosphatase
MDYIEQTVKKNYIYQGKILNLRRDDAELPDGRPCVREIVEHSGGACVLYIKENKVLLVRQYRYAYGESLYEIPAGKLEAGEDPKCAAFRELEEEAGVRAEELNLLYVMYPTPGYTNEKIYIYQAVEGRETVSAPDQDEFLDVEYLHLDKVKEMLKTGEIRDGKTIVALQAYLLSEKE